MKIGVHLRQHHKVVNIHGRQQLTYFERIATTLFERIRSPVGGRADGAAGQRQTTLAEFVLQPLRFGRKVAERTQFDGAEAGFGDFVKELRPVGLFGVVGEPDAPRIGCGSQMQPRSTRASFWLRC